MTAPPPIRPVAPAWRLVATLSGAGMLAGLLLVLVHQATQPAIQAHRAERLRRAIQEVLGGPERYEERFVVNGVLASEPPADAEAETVYLGFDESGEPLGVAVVAAEPGYQDVVRLMFGYDPRRDVLLGMKVLESRETPGLGDKIEKDLTFVAQFAGAQPPLEGVKAGQSGDDPSRIDMITGATISSRAVIRIIDHALERIGPALRGGGSTP